MSELRRWTDDAPAEYALAKRAHAQLGPDSDQLRRMLARLPVSTGEAAAPSAERATSAAPPLGTKSWLWLVPVLALLGAASWWMRDDAGEPVSRAPSPSALPTSEQPVQAIAKSDSDVAVEPTAEPTRALPRRRAQPTVTTPNPAAELALLERARRVLASEPTRTLVLTDEHRQSFRPGLFAEERELLAIEALTKLRRHQAATARARAFARAYPNSLHKRRLDAILRGEAVR